MGLKKINYYIQNGFLDNLPRSFFNYKKSEFSEESLKRINYCNKLNSEYKLSTYHLLSSYKRPKKHSAYYFDMMKVLRYFDGSKKFSYEFGDITEVPHQPTFVKSRPIHIDNTNSILLKLNSVRHFKFIKDNKSFEKKKDLLIGRAKIFTYQPHRIDFYKKYFNHPLCDLGAVNSSEMPSEWSTSKMPIEEHLNYKFILSLEGNDVATNLKWIMSSNSIAVMPMPKYETWFMEGKLIPDYHFICIKDDYSDLEEKLNYYIQHTNKALEIIKNAHTHVEQFRNTKLEKEIAHAVVKKYFDLQK